MYMPIYCFWGITDVSNAPSFSEYVNWILSRKQHYGSSSRTTLRGAVYGGAYGRKG